MLATTTFFAGLNSTDLPPTSTRGDRFAELYFLTTDKRRVEEIIRPFAKELGNVEVSYLMSSIASALVYRISKQEIDESNRSTSLNDLLIEDMLVVKSLQHNLWIVKDNAANFDRGWIVFSPDSTGFTINSNTWESRQSCANGNFHTVRFDIDEIRAARLLSQGGSLHMGSTPAATMLVPERLRYQRFQYFVNIGRSTTDLAIKVAQYCSALEALVSTASTELSHQVSERVASVLETPGKNRVALFKQVKQAYDFRSKAVHGATIKAKDTDRLLQCAENVDRICRLLVYTYFDPGSRFRAALEGAEETLIEFFIGKVLGSESD